ncbi:hypothetical protein ACS0TY_016986 [Phlomoides rotata]
MNPSQHDQNQESKQISTWAHRAWFGGGCAVALFSIAKSLKQFSAAPTSSWSWFTATITAFATYVATDLETGIYHWSIDNYGSPKTPFFGSQIEGFLGHHQRSWVITKVQVAYNLHHAAAPVAVILFPISVLSGDPIMLMFLGVFGSSVVMKLLSYNKMNSTEFFLRTNNNARHTDFTWFDQNDLRPREFLTKPENTITDSQYQRVSPDPDLIHPDPDHVQPDPDLIQPDPDLIHSDTDPGILSLICETSKLNTSKEQITMQDTQILRGSIKMIYIHGSSSDVLINHQTREYNNRLSIPKSFILALTFTSVIFSQQFHAWSHTPKGLLPAVVVALQDAEIILRRGDHAAHHQPPFNSNYCIVSGVCNRVLDKSKLFVGLEVVVLRLLGYRPHSWIQPDFE